MTQLARPNPARQAVGAYTGLPVASLTEMYGFPLRTCLRAGTSASRSPLLRADHAGGHLVKDLVGWNGDPHMRPFRPASYALTGGGLWHQVPAPGSGARSTRLCSGHERPARAMADHPRSDDVPGVGRRLPASDPPRRTRSGHRSWVDLGRPRRRGPSVPADAPAARRCGQGPPSTLGDDHQSDRTRQLATSNQQPATGNQRARPATATRGPPRR